MGVKKGVRLYFKLLKTYAKMDVLWFLNDTRICLAYMASDSLISLSGIAGMLLLAGRLGAATGFAPAELYFMLGCALMVGGVYDLFFMSNNAGAISRIIGRGQLDHALIQPVPLPLHFATNGFAPLSGIGPLVCAIVFTTWAALQLPGGGWLLLRLTPYLLLAFCIYTAWVFAISALAFWAPYAAEEIAPEVQELFDTLAPYPLAVLGAAGRVALCTLLPVGTMAWLPARALLGYTGAGPALGLMAAVAAVCLAVATLIFRKGLKHYAKVSSPRYTGFGR